MNLKCKSTRLKVEHSIEIGYHKCHGNQKAKDCHNMSRIHGTPAVFVDIEWRLLYKQEFELIRFWR